jgi:uncharacterized protein with PIN domain
MVKRVVPNVVDSSAWLAYFADEPTATTFAPIIENVRDLVVPAICLLKVFKVVTRQRGDGPALQAVAVMQQGQVIDLDAALALAAASFGSVHGLPLADSVVYATARAVSGVVWTQDADFDGLDGVRYVPKEGVIRAK